MTSASECRLMIQKENLVAELPNGQIAEGRAKLLLYKSVDQ